MIQIGSVWVPAKVWVSNDSTPIFFLTHVCFFFLLAFEASAAEFLFLAYCLENRILYLGMIFYHHTEWPVLLSGDRFPRNRKGLWYRGNIHL